MTPKGPTASSGRQHGRPPTIRDVARAAGVSLTTVSDAINGKGRVDPQTRAKVMQAVADVDWRPKRSARALRSGRTGIIALCLPRHREQAGAWLMSSDYYMAVVAGAAAQAVESDRLLLLAPRPGNVGDIAHLDVDGIVVVDPPENDPTLAILDDANMPVVTIDRDLAATDQWWVAADNTASATALLDHLAAQGASTIAVLSTSERWAYFDDSVNAYRTWCAARGITPVIREVDLDTPGPRAELVVGEMIDAGEMPDAILALPYGAAAGTIRAARSRGLDVPGDLLVASGVDGHALETATPSITAGDLRPMEVARTAVDLLARRMEGAEAAGPVITAPRLTVRGSTSR